MGYDWDFSRLAPYVNAFFQGTLTTLWLTALVIIVGSILGVVCGLALKRSIIAALLYPILDVIRAVPPLVLILFFYYLFTIQVIGVTVPAYLVYIIAMSINLAAFTADLVRSAAEAVPRRVIESGQALGMSDAHVVRHLFIPALVRSLIAPMTALYIGMLKMSSLASVINVSEVVYAAQSVTIETTRSLEAWVIVGLIYVAIVLPATYGLRYLERLARSSVPISALA